MPQIRTAAKIQAKAASNKLMLIAKSLELLKHSDSNTSPRLLQLVEEINEATLILSTSVENLINEYEKL